MSAACQQPESRRAVAAPAQGEHHERRFKADFASKHVGRDRGRRPAHSAAGLPMNTVAVPPRGASHDDATRAQRFREAALPHLDVVYTLARYLLRDPTDAEDAVQECYLRALRHFDALRSPDVKPWLLAILRNVCRVEFGRRSRVLLHDVNAEPDQPEAAIPLWGEAQDTPETEMLRTLDAETIRGLLAALPQALREAIVLREIQELSYREIADIVGAPIGTVMSRLARGRALLREAWRKAERQDKNTGEAFIDTAVEDKLATE
jgi:RNA polymerase sigma-70 factor, ECF subfamily